MLVYFDVLHNILNVVIALVSFILHSGEGKETEGSFNKCLSLILFNIC